MYTKQMDYVISRIAALISDKIDFNLKLITIDNKGYSILI